MRVLVFLNWLGRGGVETMLLDCLPHFRARGIELAICCQGPRRELDADFEREGCRIYRIRKCALPPETAWRMASVLRESRPEVLHSHMGPTSGGAALAAARRGVPTVVSVNNLPESTLYGWVRPPVLRAVRSLWLAWHRRLIDRHARIVVGHSVADLDAFAPQWRAAPGRYRLVYNGVKTSPPALGREDCRRQLGIEPDRLVVLNISSFKRQKNHEGLLAAFARVREREPLALLVTVGDDDRRKAAIRGLAESMGLAGAVRFDATRADVWPYYAAADVLLMPSFVEGFGNVVAEAQVAGLPAVASDIPAHRESVAPECRRFLFPLPDYARSAELVLEQAAAARSGQNPWIAPAREHIRTNFPVERMAGGLGDIYTEAAGG